MLNPARVAEAFQARRADGTAARDQLDLTFCVLLADELRMMASTSGSSPDRDVNPEASPLFADPSPDSAAVIARLRETDPVHWVPGFDAWFVTRHEDVQMLFAHPLVSADPRHYERYVAPTNPRAKRWLAEPPFVGAPAGAPSRARRLVSTAFTARSIARVQHGIRDIVEQFAARLRKRTGVVDLVAEFTTPIPGAVIGHILGVPPKSEDERRFHKLSRRMVRTVNPILSDRKRQRIESATAELCEYLLELVYERRDNPGDDLISDLVRASHVHEASPSEIAHVVSGLVSTGTESIRLTATRALHTLLRHPAELTRLRSDPELLPSAVDELLRYDTGLLGMPRYVLEDFELRGRSLRRGQLVVLSFMGAHRDPGVFDSPDRLDLSRDTRDLVAFGHGTHYCMGANVARAELRLMLSAALDFLPEGARLRETDVCWRGFGPIANITSLPVDFGD